MSDKKNKPQSDPRRDSISMVGPYARIRVIAAVIIFALTIVAVAVRMFSG